MKWMKNWKSYINEFEAPNKPPPMGLPAEKHRGSTGNQSKEPKEIFTSGPKSDIAHTSDLKKIKSKGNDYYYEPGMQSMWEALQQTWGKGGAGIMIVCTEDGTALLTLRAKGVDQSGQWGIPGGAIKTGDLETWHDTDSGEKVKFSEEQIRKTAIEETTEELGSVPNIKRELGKTVYKQGTFSYTSYIIDISKQEKETWTPRIKLNWESDEAKWFPIGDFPEPIHFGVTYIMQNHPLWQRLEEMLDEKTRAAKKGIKLKSVVDEFEKYVNDPPTHFITFHTVGEKVGVHPRASSSGTPSGVYTWALIPRVFEAWKKDVEKETGKTPKDTETILSKSLRFSGTRWVSLLKPVEGVKIWDLSKPVDKEDVNKVGKWLINLEKDMVNEALNKVPDKYKQIVQTHLKDISGIGLTGLRELMAKIMDEMQKELMAKGEEEWEAKGKILDAIYHPINKIGDKIRKLNHYKKEVSEANSKPAGKLYRLIFDIINHALQWRSRKEYSVSISIHKWNAVLKNLGYDIVYDGCTEYIYTGEACQAVFLDINAFNLIGTFKNPAREKSISHHHQRGKKKRGSTAGWKWEENWEHFKEEEEVDEQTEPFQQMKKEKHPPQKKRLIGLGGNKTKSYPGKPSFERNKSAPPGTGGSP